ncbi:hypothetical protein ETB97_008694 [Aspergillus alliaceus]|uniref:Glucose-methanol-choline oxidoreductase N-terminal domain-containing protein n=1 Tax=Petromyces alliaceus TaxID=209559 RepID=A0A8H6AFB2_PETAA|nr:hypothetical protein ETB97_008694 [Aspergillus burnettii]
MDLFVSKLSENAFVSVLVIETDSSVLNIENLTDVSRLPFTYNSPIDWAYEATLQNSVEIIIRDSANSDDNIIAIGVEIEDPESTKQLIRAGREVILTAGAMRSPAILEFSGFGNPRSVIR